MKNKVLIMLSTYNGQKYIREQLDSLYAQKDVDIHILVRDDGSKDSTVDILKEYQVKYGKMTIHADENVGAAKSFYRLMDYSMKHYPHYDYYAFCDQDDVWKQDKLKNLIDEAGKSSNRYKLVYSNVYVTDEKLNIKKELNKNPQISIYSNIVASGQLGCTQLFNYALLEKACIISLQTKDNDYLPLHDGWISLVAFSLNGEVMYCKKPTMYYRQHSSNVVGNKNSNILKTIIRRIKRFYATPNRKSLKCQYVLMYLNNEISEKNRNILEQCAWYKKSILRRIKLAFNSSFYENDFIKNCGFTLSVLFGKF